MTRNAGAFREGPLGHNPRSGNGLFQDVGMGPQGLIERVTYFNDFTNADVDLSTTLDWEVTQVSGGGTAEVDITRGVIQGHGALILDCPADEDGPIVQNDGNGAAGLSPLGITPAAAVAGTTYASECTFAAKMMVQDVTEQGFFVGLAELNGTNSDVMATPEGGITSDTHVGFGQSDAEDGAWLFSVAGDDDTAAVTVAVPNALTDGEWIEIGFTTTGTLSATGYYRTLGDRNWTLIGSLVPAAAWDAQMLITFANLGGDAGDDLYIDYVYFSTRRTLVI